MTRPRLAHLAWSKAHQGWSLSLADSSVCAPDLEALGLPHQAPVPRPGEDPLPALERALGARLGAPGGRVLVTAGASEANACVIAGLLDPGDEILVESPAYEPLRLVPSFFGVRARAFTRERDHGYGRVREAVEAALAPATRLVLFTDLHNPGGVPLEDADAEALTALAARRGLWLACDETFRDASRRPTGTWSALSERWVTTSTLTKPYGLGALRIGWISGSADALERCANAQNALSVEPARTSAGLALALAPHLDALRERAWRILEENRALFARAVDSLPRVDPGPAPRGTTAFLRFPGAGEGDSFAAFAAERFGLLVVPGRFFGDPDGVRIGLGEEPSRFAAAIEVLREAARAFAGSGATAGGSA
ncbi:MAG TPA: pyridoxal phosphate-dependent aminotransferase [Terriglobales bacterium]|nr:pyridoxal phosphate-dependent aminotransferase [Terriglobales bacterium]